MFGTKLKTWMEHYIGRGKKKEIQKDKTKSDERGAVILESSESLAQSDTGISSSSQQVLSSSTTDYREAYSTTTMESERSGMTQTHTAVSLPSPESAYSTGYSTDGASPGAIGPPEYYINIRTGKHYFPSPAPTPTSPPPENNLLQLHSGNKCLPNVSLNVSRIERELSSSSSSSSCKFGKFSSSFAPQVDYFPGGSAPRQISAPNDKSLSSKKSSGKSQLSSLKLFLKSPKNECERPKCDVLTESKKNLISNGKSKKWFKQPFQKFGHRRTDSADERRLDVKTPFEKNFCYLMTQENSASPRQRNRIKTNPWLPTEPLSFVSFNNLNFSPMLARNRSCSNTPLQNRKTSQPDTFVNRIKFEERLTGNPVVELSDHSEEDLTLNEMMGTYNESYVYEKETDILSDSDPTDCEDYGTDSEANNGGDEQDSHDDELDFIDNGSIIETAEENFPRNTGKCTYYDSHVRKSSFLFKNERHHSRKCSEGRKDSKIRREKRRQSRKSFNDIKKINQKVEVMANTGTKSAEVTPVIGRRQKITNVKKEEKRLENLYLGDAEADLKYKKLIEEAENIFESLRNSPACKIKKQTNLTLTKPDLKSTINQSREETPVKKPPKDLKLSIETPKQLKRQELKSSLKAHSPLDPLGPSLRNFAVFKPNQDEERKISTSSSEEFENGTRAFSGTPIVPIAFQSVDFGKALTSYCPQSEPVKRKIYTCSKTYDKLVRRFENKEQKTGLKICLNGNQGSTPFEGVENGERAVRTEGVTRIRRSSPKTSGVFKRNGFILEKTEMYA